jgi:N-acetylglucosaminyl-diphospho-decaprenol L-rhamnosyltransferase
VLRDVGCVVVHHRNYPGVLTTLEAILEGGVPAEQVVLVDNSEDPKLAAVLQEEIPTGIRLLTQANLGYGHAANAGIHVLQSDPLRPKYILISTHETIPESDAISTMVQTLRVTGADVVGPTLIDRECRGGTVWSTGGELSRFLNIPIHTRSALSAESYFWDPVQRAWLDGAFCLYKSDALLSIGFREDYFLYFEEVDLHIRIKKAGGKVLWTPAAHVSQISSGIPSYYQTRNMYIFQSSHGNAAQRALTPAYSLLRSALRESIGERHIIEFRDMWHGFLDGRRLVKHGTSEVTGGSVPNRTAGA